MSAFHAGNRGELVLSDAEGNPFAVQQELVRLRRIQILLLRRLVFRCLFFTEWLKRKGIHCFSYPWVILLQHEKSLD
jgi:hypothetical protein